MYLREGRMIRLLRFQFVRNLASWTIRTILGLLLVIHPWIIILGYLPTSTDEVVIYQRSLVYWVKEWGNSYICDFRNSQSTFILFSRTQPFPHDCVPSQEYSRPFPSGSHFLQQVVPHVFNLEDPNVTELIRWFPHWIDQGRFHLFTLLFNFGQSYYFVTSGSGHAVESGKLKVEGRKKFQGK